MNSFWKKTLRRLTHGSQGFAKDEEAADINKAAAEPAKLSTCLCMGMTQRNQLMRGWNANRSPTVRKRQEKGNAGRKPRKAAAQEDAL